MTTIEVQTIERDDATLVFTSDKRRLIIDQLMPAGKISKDDPKSVALLLTALADEDRQALSSKRIKVEQSAVDNNQQAAALIAQVLGEAGSRRQNNPIDVEARIIREAPMLGSEIPPPQLVEGEISEGLVVGSYEAFMARQPPV